MAGVRVVAADPVEQLRPLVAQVNR